MKLARLSVLSEDEIKQIHEASLHILEDCGVKVLHPGMLESLGEHGLPVDREDQRVCFPRAAVENAVECTPSKFEMYDREGEFAFVLGDGETKIAAGHNAVFWVDSETGETRPSTIADVEKFARICEGLSGIDAIGIPVMPQDVPDPKKTLLYGVRACIENSRKPLFFSTDNAEINRTVIAMMEAVFPGNLRENPYGISQLSPTSPLFWEEGVLDAVCETVEHDVPLAILPEPMAGVSAPYTLAGLLTVNNAEFLSGLVIAQLLKPKSKILYANSWTTTDMRNGRALVGSVETSICRVAGAQMARFYQIPSHTTAPNSDNHAHDEQNAWEKTFSTLAAVVAGNDLIVNCGMFATGMTCSHEQLVMDEEIASLSKRFVAGTDVSEESIAKDLIQEIGPRGDGYLISEHTLSRLRGGEFFAPRVAVRGPHASWEAGGSQDSYAIAKSVSTFLGAKQDAPLDKQRLEALRTVLGP